MVSDRTLRLVHHQRDLLGAQLAAPYLHPGRQGAAAADGRAVDPLVARLPPPPAPPAGHLRHLRRPRRLHRVHEGVHHHRLALLPVRRRAEHGHQQVLLNGDEDVV